MTKKQDPKNGEFKEHFSDDLNKKVGFFKSGKILKDKTEVKKEDDDNYSEITYSEITFQNKKRNYKKLL